MRTPRPPLLASLALLLGAAAFAAPDGPEAPDRVVLDDGTEIAGRLVRIDGDGARLLRLRVGDAEFGIPAAVVREIRQGGPAPAPAAPPPRDLVRLSDGGLVPGEVLEEGPDGVRMRAGGREIAIPAAKVVSVEKGGADAAAATAAPPEGRGGRGGRGAGFALFRDPVAGLVLLAERLELSGEQKPKVKEALDVAVAALAAARDVARAGGDRAAVFTAFRDAVGAFRGRMKEILTDVQFRKLSEILPAPDGGGRR